MASQTPPQIRWRGRRAERHGDARIVGQPPAAVGPLPDVAARDVLPLRVGEVAERRRDRPDVLLDLRVRREGRVKAEVAADAIERRRLDGGPDIVHDQAPDRALRLRRDDDAQEPAHRGADPVHRLGAAARDQRDQRGQVGRERRNRSGRRATRFRRGPACRPPALGAWSPAPRRGRRSRGRCARRHGRTARRADCPGHPIRSRRRDESRGATGSTSWWRRGAVAVSGIVCVRQLDLW